MTEVLPRRYVKTVAISWRGDSPLGHAEATPATCRILGLGIESREEGKGIVSIVVLFVVVSSGA
jgi:hypothetical protein